MMKKIRTALRDIDQHELGLTYTHEHLYTFPPKQQKDRDLEISDYEKSREEVLLFKKAGGKTIVEGTTIDYGRRPDLLGKMMDETGINIVFVSGWNKQIYYPKRVFKTTIEKLAQEMINDIEVGAGRTKYRAGHLKGGSWYNVIMPGEIKTAKAISIAHKKTNAPIWVHTETGTMGPEMLDLFLEEGVDPSALAIGHLDRNPDIYNFKYILKKGAFVQFDSPSKIKYGTDIVRINLIKQLIEVGYVKQILIAGDMGRASYLKSYGGGPGFEFLIKKFIPRLIEEGVSKENIKQIFEDNPKRWLARF